MDEMGDRMKAYERATAQRLDPCLPILARIDGRAFSAFTRGCQKPFDPRVSGAMRATAAYLVEESHARIGYVQSDEITLVWQAEEGGSVFFDGKVLKMASVLASLAAAKFNQVFGGERLAAFDCRVWQVPNQMEAANTVLWRCMDARKNSVSSACRSMFSAKKMHKKNQADMRAMMAEAGVDFDSAFDADDRHGVFFRRVTGEVEIDDETWAKIPEKHRPATRLAVRSWVDQVPCPYFGDVENRVGFIFAREGGKP
jgi:tRNA(His) guanylyltransferase